MRWSTRRRPETERTNMVADNQDVAKDVQQYLPQFIRDTGMPGYLLKPRLEFQL